MKLIKIFTDMKAINNRGLFIYKKCKRDLYSVLENQNKKVLFEICVSFSTFFALIYELCKLARYIHLQLFFILKFNFKIIRCNYFQQFPKLFVY